MVVRLWACEAVCRHGDRFLIVVEPEDVNLLERKCIEAGMVRRKEQVKAPLRKGEYVVWEL